VLLIDRLHGAYGKDFDHVLLACVAGALVIVATVVLVRTFLLGHLAAGERETFKSRPARGSPPSLWASSRHDPRAHLGRQRPLVGVA